MTKGLFIEIFSCANLSGEVLDIEFEKLKEYKTQTLVDLDLIDIEFILDKYGKMEFYDIILQELE